jgi:GNAT superfamily N-acetyltransferase
MATVAPVDAGERLAILRAYRMRLTVPFGTLPDRRLCANIALMPRQFVIRRAAGADVEVLTDLAHRAKAHWRYPASWLRSWDPQLTITTGYLEIHDVWVADAGGSLVGMCALEDRGTSWGLEHVWVEPSEHRRGIGRALVRHALAEAARVRRGPVQLLSDPYAIGFYERLGARYLGEAAAPMPGAPERTLPIYEFALEL